MEKTCVNDKFKFIIPTGRNIWGGGNEWLFDDNRRTTANDMYKEMMVGESMVIAGCEIIEDPQPTSPIDDDDDEDDEESRDRVGKIYLSDLNIAGADKLLRDLGFAFPDDYDLDRKRIAVLAAAERGDYPEIKRRLETYVSTDGIGPRREGLKAHCDYAW